MVYGLLDLLGHLSLHLLWIKNSPPFFVRIVHHHHDWLPPTILNVQCIGQVCVLAFVFVFVFVFFLVFVLFIIIDSLTTTWIVLSRQVELLASQRHFVSLEY